MSYSIVVPNKSKKKDVVSSHIIQEIPHNPTIEVSGLRPKSGFKSHTIQQDDSNTSNSGSEITIRQEVTQHSTRREQYTTTSDTQIKLSNKVTYN